MRTDTAVQLVDQIVSKPGWELRASVCDRFEDCVIVRVNYPTVQFNRDHAPQYEEAITADASFRIPVGEMVDPTELYKRIMDIILEIEVHEHREAFRIAPTYWAPFHPHRNDGIGRWGEPHKDYMFGVV